MNKNDRPQEVKLSRNIEDNLDYIKSTLGYEMSFDIIIREFSVAGKSAALVFIDGFSKDQIVTRIMDRLLSAKKEDILPRTISKLVQHVINYAEVTPVGYMDQLINEVLSGPMALLLDGDDEALIIDTRSYPARTPEEPKIERVLRGSRDGFTETLVYNTALIRRRIRDPKLRIELLKVGLRSKTDVALAYIEDIVNPTLVDEVRARIQAIEVDGIPMAEKSVEEFITRPRAWWNPFPVVRYTERADVAAIHLMEGHVAVIVDTSPSVIILPVTLFHHVQHAEEYREDVMVGAYIRLIRIIAIFLSWVGPPLWIALVLQKGNLPEWLSVLGPKKPATVPIVLQFVFGEIGLDIIRMALIHTPDALSAALGFIGAILLGEMAAMVGLFSPETILYIGIAALGTFATPSMEFAMAIRLSRLGFLLLAGWLEFPGVLIAALINFVLLASTRSFGVPYLWPLIPFDGKAFWSVLIRRPLPAKGQRPSILQPRDLDRLPALRAKPSRP